MPNDNSFYGYIKETILGGVFFLIPLTIILYGIGNIKVYMTKIAGVIAPDRQINSVLGLILANIFVVIVFLCIAFFIGLLVRQQIFRKTRNNLGDFVAKIFPAYPFIKAYTEDLAAVDRASEAFIPVMIDLGSTFRLGFQIDRLNDGWVAIYLPGTPNPWSGNVSYVAETQCRRLPVSLHDAVDYCRNPGGSKSSFPEILREIKFHK